jgi:hypothetical protein
MNSVNGYTSPTVRICGEKSYRHGKGMNIKQEILCFHLSSKLILIFKHSYFTIFRVIPFSVFKYLKTLVPVHMVKKEVSFSPRKKYRDVNESVNFL